VLLLAPLAIAMPPPSAAPEAASVHPSEPPIGIPQLDALSLEPEFTSHLATSEDIARMRDAYGVREPGVTYGGLYEGHGTGLAPPTEEEYEDMVGTITVMDGVSLSSSLPSSVDLSASPYFPAIGNQGGLNSCAVWAMGYYTTGFIHARANGWDEAYLGTNTSQLMSPAFLYNVEAAGTDTGTTTLQIAKIAANTGQSTWATMPYDGLECTSWPSEAAMREAPLYRIDEGFETAISRDPDVIKAWLAQGSVLPVTVGMDSFSHLGPDDPVITSTEFEPVFKNHAVTIVGYDDTMVADGDVGGFKMVNSWGTNWGDTWGSGGYYWMTYDAFREDYHSVFRVRGGAKVEPSLLATFGKSAGASDGWYDVTFGIEGTFIQKPLPWRWSSGHVPDLLVWDVTEYAQYMGAATFQLTVRSWGDNPPTITSFALEWYDGGYTRGSATSVVRAEDVPQSADCTINITWPGITVEATTPGNGTWHTDNVTISGTAAANVTRTIISEDFEGVWGADWYIDDINPTGGVDTWGETTRRVHSGERSLWCAGSDGGAALFDDFDNSAGFVTSWYRSSEGPDVSQWTKVTSGYRG
ncbi:MAG: C1 family peptidase, partial [Thermoplasmata archaeon]|nr:C1 family peptidase [Thermoplasmata archaeon]